MVFGEFETQPPKKWTTPKANHRKTSHPHFPHLCRLHFPNFRAADPFFRVKKKTIRVFRIFCVFTSSGTNSKMRKIPPMGLLS